jgi:hypothetical protein
VAFTCTREDGVLLLLLCITGAGRTGKHKSSYKPHPSSVMPAAPRKVTAAEAGDASQLASLMQFKAALDPEGVLDKVRFVLGHCLQKTAAAATPSAGCFAFL